MYYQLPVKNHEFGYLANASLCSERHPKTQSVGLNTVLFNELNIGMGHSAMVVVYAAYRQRSLYIETRMVGESCPLCYPAQNCIETIILTQILYRP